MVGGVAAVEGAAPVVDGAVVVTTAAVASPAVDGAAALASRSHFYFPEGFESRDAHKLSGYLRDHGHSVSTFLNNGPGFCVLSDDAIRLGRQAKGGIQ